MAIKPNTTEYDVVNNNPLVFSLFNYGSSSASAFPPLPNSFMITEIAGDIMITEAGDYMVTEF